MENSKTVILIFMWYDQYCSILLAEFNVYPKRWWRQERNPCLLDAREFTVAQPTELQGKLRVIVTTNREEETTSSHGVWRYAISHTKGQPPSVLVAVVATEI